MKQKEKQLLLKDLCARLPYGVICTDNRHGDSRVFYIDVEDEKVYYTDFDEYGLIEYCMPYLRSMSSMTEKEKNKWTSLMRKEYREAYPNSAIDTSYYEYFPTPESFDYLIENMFDYRGLIPKGLAIEASKDMYKTK